MSAGVQSAISFKKESTWGTAVVPDKSIAVRPTGGIDIKEDIQMIPAIRGGLQKNYDAIKGKVGYEGAYTFDAFADYLGYFLLSAFGSDSVATPGGETIVYSHTFSEIAAKPSMTIEQAISEHVRRYAGAIVDQLKITSKTGEKLMVEAGFKAKTQATATAITPAFTIVPSFDHTQVIVKIGGSTIGEVESFELEYKNGISMVHALGNAEPSYAAIEGGSEVSGKMDLYLDSTTLTEMSNYVNKTTRSLELIATGSAIGNASNYVLDLLIPKAVYTAAESKITDNHNLLSISFNGYYDTATSKLISAVLTNLTSAY